MTPGHGHLGRIALQSTSYSPSVVLVLSHAPSLGPIRGRHLWTPSPGFGTWLKRELCGGDPKGTADSRIHVVARPWRAASPTRRMMCRGSHRRLPQHDTAGVREVSAGRHGGVEAPPDWSRNFKADSLCRCGFPELVFMAEGDRDYDDINRWLGPLNSGIAARKQAEVCRDQR